VLVLWQESARMSSAKVGFEMRANGRPVPTTRVEGGAHPPRMEEGARLVS
jgi:hypothetical protein